MSPAQRDAGDALQQLLEQSAAILARSLPPDGIQDRQAINELLGLLDGPVCRIVVAKWREQREKE